MTPDSWRTVKLQDCLEKIIDYRGKSPPKSEDGIPLITARNVRDGFLDFTTQEYIDASEYDKWMSRGLPKSGDLLFTTEAPLGKVALFPQDGKYAVAQRLITLRGQEGVSDSKYLLYYFLSDIGSHKVRIRATGSTAIGIKQSELRKVPVVLPPFPEQRKIVEILGTWDKAIALTEQLIAAKQQRKKGLMQQLLTGRRRFGEFVQTQETQNTKLGMYPKEWTIQRLSDIAGIQSSNVDKKFKSSEQPVFLCNYMDVFNNDYIHNQIEFMDASATEAEVNKFALQTEDVIITKDSETREEIAEPCVVAEDLENVVCGYHLTILRPRRNVVSGFFLKDILRSPNVHLQFVKFANGITRFGLTLSAIRNALVPVPPMEEQRKIATVLRACDTEIDLLHQKLAALQHQKKGLMQQLLTGRVRVKV